MKKFLSVILCISIMCSSVSCGEKSATSQSDVQLNCWFNVDLGDSLIYRDTIINTPMLLDYETMSTTSLCNITNCSHTSVDCVVMGLNAEEQLPIIYNNCAYYFLNSCYRKQVDGKNALDLSCNVMMYDFKNMKTKKVATITGCNVDTSTSAILIDSEYYFTTNYGNPKYDESGNVISTSNIGGGNLMSINLKTNEITDYGEIFDYEALKEEYPSSASSTSKKIVGKCKNKLYITVTYRKEERKVSKSPEFYGKTYSFDLVSKKIEFIDDYFTLSVSDDYIAYILSTTNNEMQIKNIETDSIVLGPHVDNFLNINILNNMVWNNSKCLNINNNIEKNFSELSNATVVGVYDNHYIISGLNEDDGKLYFEKIPCEEIDSLFE